MLLTTEKPRPHQRTRRLGAALAAAACAGTALVLVPAAPAGATDATTAVVRSAHFSPDTAGVDVYLQPLSGGATSLWIAGETYGQVSQYQRLSPGVYVVAMRPHGAAASTPPAISWTLEVAAGRAYTAAAIGRNAALQAIVLADDPASAPAGSGRVRVVQGASDAAAVTVEANGGTKLASGLTFGTVTPYSVVTAGTWDLRATGSGTSSTSGQAQVSVAAGTSSTVVVVGTPSNGLGLFSFVDTGASGQVPAGSVDAGAGATAATGSSTLGVVALASGAGLAAAGLVLLTRRAVRPRRTGVVTAGPSGR